MLHGVRRQVHLRVETGQFARCRVNVADVHVVCPVVFCFGVPPIIRFARACCRSGRRRMVPPLAAPPSPAPRRGRRSPQTGGRVPSIDPGRLGSGAADGADRPRSPATGRAAKAGPVGTADTGAATARRRRPQAKAAPGRTCPRHQIRMTLRSVSKTTPRLGAGHQLRFAPHVLAGDGGHIGRVVGGAPGKVLAGVLRQPRHIEGRCESATQRGLARGLGAGRADDAWSAHRGARSNRRPRAATARERAAREGPAPPKTPASGDVRRK